MQFFERLSVYRPQALAILRIVVGLLFLAHGMQKLLGFPAPMQAGGGSLPPLIYFAGLLEMVGGALITVGLLTRPVAFVLSGQMAFAYFMGHYPKNFFPVNNGGDAAILFCFVFLYFVFSGAGVWSVDSVRKARTRKGQPRGLPSDC